MKKITVTSSIDGSSEPSLFQLASGRGKRPLLVGLHTWSAELSNQVDKMLPLAKRRKWSLLLPEFRGPNLTTNPRAREACATRLAKQDIIDAVNYVIKHYESRIDTANILLLGGSGGGHMALMMAGYQPRLWKAVSAWCPITDLAVWHKENKNYASHIAACCGGVPSVKTKKEYAARSPMTHINAIAKACVHINHGKWDPSVPSTHSYTLYQALTKKYPQATVYLNIFNGGHDLHYEEAFAVLDSYVSSTTQSALTK